MPKLTYGDPAGVNRILKKLVFGDPVTGVNRPLKKLYYGFPGVNILVFDNGYIALSTNNAPSFSGSVSAVDNGTTITLNMDGQPTSGIETRAICRIGNLNIGDKIEATIAYTRNSGDGAGYFMETGRDFYNWQNTIAGTYSAVLTTGNYAWLALTSWKTGTYSKQSMIISNIKVNGTTIYP